MSEKRLGIDHSLEKYSSIKGSENWKTIKPIHKGWSKDKKFYIETKDQKKYLLRVSDGSKYESKKEAFELLNQIGNLPIIYSKPISFGKFNNESEVYMLMTWIEGEEAEKVIPTLEEKEQYTLGVKAGKALKIIHSQEVEVESPEWAERFNRKIDRNIERYEACEYKFDGSDRIIDYINKNRKLLEGKEQVFQHGDFHIGNMLITEDHNVGIIDFDRLDYGEPWEEFNRITFCATTSGAFASGRIDGYFDGKVPDEFFRLMALYIGSNQLASIPWAVPFGEKDIAYMMEQAKRVMSWYDGYRSYIPSWYREGMKVEG